MAADVYQRQDDVINIKIVMMALMKSIVIQ